MGLSSLCCRKRLGQSVVVPARHEAPDKLFWWTEEEHAYPGYSLIPKAGTSNTYSVKSIVSLSKGFPRICCIHEKS